MGGNQQTSQETECIDAIVGVYESDTKAKIKINGPVM